MQHWNPPPPTPLPARVLGGRPPAPSMPHDGHRSLAIPILHNTGSTPPWRAACPPHTPPAPWQCRNPRVHQGGKRIAPGKSTP